MSAFIKLITAFIKFFFLCSATISLLTLLIPDLWVSEMALSLSVFHTLSTVVFIIGFYFLQMKCWLLGSVVFFAAQNMFILMVYFNTDSLTQSKDDEVLTVAQYNVHYMNRNVENIVDWLEDNHDGFDVVFLQEVSMGLKAELQRLHKYYPYHIYKTDKRWLGRAFFSKIPITLHRTEFYDRSFVHYLVVNLKTHQGKDIKFYGVHTTSPFSSDTLARRNHEFSETANIFVQDKSEYKIIAGDFNSTPYSRAFMNFLKATGLKRPRTHTGSWPSNFIPPTFRIQIDHLLVSDKIDYLSQETGKDCGSDHLPVITGVVLRK